MFFLDFEASSIMPGSYPIEVGWVGADGHGRSYLIQPHADWLRTGRWDYASESIHGIPQRDLLAHGQSLPHVAQQLLDAVAGHDVYSDNPSFDSGWLDTLLDYADRRERVDLISVDRAYEAACQAVPEPAVRYRIVADAKRQDVGRRHRALDDAMAMWKVWRAISAEAELWTAHQA